MLKLLVIEDHVLVREGLLQALRDLERGARALGASDSTTALALLEGNSDIEMIVLDLMLPGLNGFSFLRVLRKRYPSIPVVVLSALEDPDTVQKVMRHGASGFVGKSSSSKILIRALRKVLKGEVCVPEKYAVLEEVPARDTKVHLTPTQTRVLDLLTEGYPNREIADLLGVTVGTVKMHLFNIYKLLNVNSRAQALIALKKLGIKL
ncbi:MAG: response regulator transcription factor [Georgfuchsia sp.]